MVVTVAVAAGDSGSTDILSITDDKFSDWLAKAGNAEKWEASLNDPKSYA